MLHNNMSSKKNSILFQLFQIEFKRHKTRDSKSSLEVDKRSWISQVLKNSFSC